MDSLLCDEEWLMSPNKNNVLENEECCNTSTTVSSTRQDCEETFRMFMEKEESFMPKSEYLNLLKSSNFIRTARLESVNWLIKTQKRMNLSNGIVLVAINYLDRYISSNDCQVWKYGMFELLSMACLTVASKFNQMNTPALHEFQVDRTDDFFSASMIQKMELTLLESLGWRMDCITPFSFIELLIQIIDVNKARVVELNSCATKLLVDAVSGVDVIGYRPSVIAISVVKCILEDSHSPTDILQCLNKVMPPVYKDELIKCHKNVKDFIMSRHSCGNSLTVPSSPVTVLYNNTRKRKQDQLGYVLSRK